MAQTNPDSDLDHLWQEVREALRRGMPAATFRQWIEPLEPVTRVDGALYVTGPKRVRTWVDRRYRAQIEDAMRRVDPELGPLFLVDRESEATQAPERELTPMPIDPKHTFERFVIGPGNRFAHAAALAVAELPGEAYNPLFLHGPPGLGKTHLMGAIARYLREHHPTLKVHYTTAERFTSEFVATLRTDGPERFKERYRSLDALLIDDVQVLEGKPRTEEEFVHTFNALYAAGKQIVLSSDRPPSALSRIEQRLRDRFQWGLTVEIEPPDLRTRVALLWRFASDAVDQLPDPQVLREIASAAPGNVRGLEGALTRVLAMASIFGEPLERGVVERAFGGAKATRGGAPASITAPSVQAIQDAVCSVLGISREELLSPRRTPRVARARQLAMYLCRELTPLSLAQIAREFDRDHSTVLHAIRAVESRLEPGSQIHEDVDRIRGELSRAVDSFPRRTSSATAAHTGPQGESTA
ncbi:MAG TPA: chromosomal replication initiator protein DnaA [Solirubrobacterales bacterium]